MRRFLTFIISLGLLFGFATSCGVSSKSSNDTTGIFNHTAKIGESFGTFSIEVYQVLSSTEALCYAYLKNSYVRIFLLTIKDVGLYDGLIITDTWYFVDTYTYTTTEEKQKTVPIIASAKDFL